MRIKTRTSTSSAAASVVIQSSKFKFSQVHRKNVKLPFKYETKKNVFVFFAEISKMPKDERLGSSAAHY